MEKPKRKIKADILDQEGEKQKSRKTEKQNKQKKNRKIGKQKNRRAEQSENRINAITKCIITYIGVARADEG